MKVKFIIGLVALCAATLAQAGAAGFNFSAGTASTTDNANYFGGGNATVNNVSMSISWETTLSSFNCTGDLSTFSTCYIKATDPSGMSASFNSMSGDFNVIADASAFQNSNSPGRGSFIEVFKNGAGTSVQWYVNGAGFLESGNFNSTAAFNTELNAALDPTFISQVGQGTSGLAWFVSAPWDASGATYYPNGGDYFPTFGVQSVDAATPEPSTWFSLVGGLGLVASLKFRRR